MKVASSELLGQFDGPIDLLVTTASFEARCLTVARNVASRVLAACILRNKEVEAGSAHHMVALRTLLAHAKPVEVPASLSSATATADALLRDVIPRACSAKRLVVVDTTTFTHEQLLILLALLSSARPSAKVVLAYNGAQEYSSNTTEEAVWLSRGVKNVRSVLGFPGAFVPTKRLHLMILVGFESERALSLIDYMEPTHLSLGLGAETASVSAHHFARNRKFHGRLSAFIDRQARLQASVDTFEFSCVDPVAASSAVIDHASRFERYNTVVCPMNTKLSTVGVAIAALTHPALSVVYAEPEEYNQEGYSTPSDSVSLVEWPHLQQAALS
jgi:hypothetical protein